jgi:hypothetical protein
VKAQNIFADLEALFPGAEPVHHRAVVAIGWKLAPTAPPMPSLFDLAADPFEQIGSLDSDGAHDGYLEALLKVHERAANRARARHPPQVLPAPPAPR